MFLVDKKLKKTKLTLCLMAILHSQAIYTAELSSDANSVVSIAIVSTVSNDHQPLSADANNMVWPLLPGDSINSLAALFYPKNPIMQRRFVNRTLQLNQQTGRELDPENKANLVDLILIPDIKTLGKNSGKIKARTFKYRNTSHHSHTSRLHLSYQLKDASLFIVSDQMQTNYSNLVKRNASLKLELEKLNANLAKLQQILSGLKTQAINLLNHALPGPNSKTSPIARLKLLIEKPVQNASLITASQPLQTTSDNDKRAFYNSFYIWMLAILLAIIVLFISRQAFTKRQAKNLYLAATGDFGPYKTGIFNSLDPLNNHDKDLPRLDFLLTQNGLSEGMSVVDLSEVEGWDYKEEGELILEQARIYLNIARVDEATELLKAQIKAMPKASLHHWLYLLDIYRDHQQQSEFLHYAKQLHETFNVMMPLWGNATLPIVMASSLEEFSHIMKNLTELWKNPEPLIEAKAYIDELITDNRASERAGFSMEVFQELVLLRDLLAVRANMVMS